MKIIRIQTKRIALLIRAFILTIRASGEDVFLGLEVVGRFPYRILYGR
jgi:hypothetical protein